MLFFSSAPLNPLYAGRVSNIPVIFQIPWENSPRAREDGRIIFVIFVIFMILVIFVIFLIFMILMIFVILIIFMIFIKILIFLRVGV